MNNAEFYHKYFVDKTLQSIYDMLPFAGYTRILCDNTGFYKPALHRERFGHETVKGAYHYADEIIYVETGDSVYENKLKWDKQYKKKKQKP